MNTTGTEIRLNEKGKRFEITVGDATAYIDYAWQKDSLALLYIFVPVPFRGQGYSTLLIEYVMQYARTNQLKLKIYCSYISGYIRRHPEHHDLLISKE